MACTRPHDLLMVAKRELPEGELRAALAHIDACADCTAEAKRLDTLFARFASLREKQVEASGDFAWRVRAALIAANPELLQRRAPEPKRHWIPTWALAGAFAALMIAVVSVFMVTEDYKGGAQPSPSHLVTIVTPTPAPRSAYLSSTPTSVIAKDLHAALVSGDAKSVSSRFDVKSILDAIKRFDFTDSKVGAVRTASFEVALADGRTLEVSWTSSGTVTVDEKK